MLFKILFLALICSGAFAADVEFLPVNVHDVDQNTDTDGLVFFFGEPAASQAVITVEAVQNGKAAMSTQIIDTDRVHGEHVVFDMLIDDGHRQELIWMRIAIGGTVYTIDHPKSGVQYRLDPPRRKRK